MGIAELARRTVHRANRFANGTHSFFEQHLYLRCKAARIPFDFDVRRNRIADAIGVQFSTGNDRWHVRINISRNNCLQSQDDFRRNDQRIFRHMRPRRMRSLPFNTNNKVIFTGHNATDSRGDSPGFHTRHIMQTVDFLYAKAFNNAIVHHRSGAIARFLSRLKNKADRAVKILPLQ